MLPPLSLYVHLPWCIRKCPYCDFNSHALTGQLDETAYVEALATDLSRQAELAAGREIETVFFGGGTPSLFSARAIGCILKKASAAIGLADGAEVALEANPGTVEHDAFSAYRSAGVTRLSLGIQSFDNRILAGIGRIHDGDDAARALDDALAAGFDAVNADLMYGLPGQAPEDAIGDIERAIRSGVTHISHYELTIEPNTWFHKFPPSRPAAETRWQMESACAEELHRCGYGHYEVSAWAVGGARCRHNLNYWRFGDYIGIGAGAHGKLTHPEAGVQRTMHERHPRTYCTRVADGPDVRPIPERDLPFEFMLNALRLRDGFETRLFSERTGLGFESVAGTLADASSSGLVEQLDRRWRPTEAGFRFLNDLIGLFLAGTAGSVVRSQTGA